MCDERGGNGGQCEVDITSLKVSQQAGGKDGIRTHTPSFSRLLLSPVNPTASDSVH